MKKRNQKEFATEKHEEELKYRDEAQPQKEKHTATKVNGVRSSQKTVATKPKTQPQQKSKVSREAKQDKKTKTKERVIMVTSTPSSEEQKNTKNIAKQNTVPSKKKPTTGKANMPTARKSQQIVPTKLDENLGSLPDAQPQQTSKVIHEAKQAEENKENIMTNPRVADIDSTVAMILEAYPNKQSIHNLNDEGTLRPAIELIFQTIQQHANLDYSQELQQQPAQRPPAHVQQIDTCQPVN